MTIQTRRISFSLFRFSNLLNGSRPLAGLFLFLFLVLPELGLAQETSAPLPPPKPIAWNAGIPAESTLAGNERQQFLIPLEVNHNCLARLEEAGAGIEFHLFDPEDRPVWNSELYGIRQQFSFQWIARQTGTYRLEINSRNAKAVPGKYRVTITGIRPATALDHLDEQAFQAFFEAEEETGEETAGALGKALEKTLHSRNLARQAGLLELEIQALIQQGVIESTCDRYHASATALRRAYQLSQTSGDLYGQALSLTFLSSTLDTLGESTQALECAQQGQTLWKRLDDAVMEAVLLNNLGLSLRSLGNLTQAQTILEQALAVFERFDEQGEISTTLNNLSLIYDDMGEKRKALSALNRALVILRAMKSQANEAVALNNLSLFHISLGEFQTALDYGQEALALSRRVQSQYGEGLALNNLANIYESLGEPAQALGLLRQALSIFRTTVNRPGEATTLNNIGHLLSIQGQKQKALSYFFRALALHRRLKSPGGIILALENIACEYSDAGQFSRSQRLFQQGLRLARAEADRWSELIIVSNLGDLEWRKGRLSQAHDHYQHALTISRALQDKPNEANLLYLVASLEASQDHLTIARDSIEEALRIVEIQRGKVVSHELRTSFFATVQDYFDLYIDILMRLYEQTNDPACQEKALQVCGQARARSLADVLTESRADIRQGANPQLVARERDLQQRLNDKTSRAGQLAGQPGMESRFSRLQEEMSELRRELMEVRTLIRQQSPRYTALVQPTPLNLAQIRARILDPDTLLLRYSLGAERSYLWLVTPDSLTSFVLPSRAEIETQVLKVYRLLTARQPNEGEKAETYAQRVLRADGEYDREAARLSAMLLEPAAAHLGTKRLAIIPDEVLEYVPFAALPEPQGSGSPSGLTASSPPFLLEKHEIVTLPSLNALDLIRKEETHRLPAAQTVAILADPVFDATDSRLTFPTAKQGPDAPQNVSQSINKRLSTKNQGPRFSRLQFSQLESEAIAALLPPDKTLKATGFAANRKVATNGVLAGFQFVHFATHSLANEEHPELSGIVLAQLDENGRPQDGFLRLPEIYNLQLPVEMVVLSACQTGLGKSVRGEGLISLTRGFMYAGAARVVASLWNIDDRASAELMKTFYQEILGEQHVRPAAALRKAQLTMLKQKRWRAPFFWAAFVMQGEWR
ncbi:MAG: CHAT domain-containing protein [Blastocatellia bacterium]|nr:CHAT domain-containing protein [Blastocatellia bacterium]